MPEEPRTYPLRLPLELRINLDLLAAAHRRSLHGEILHVLEEYAKGESVGAQRLAERLEESSNGNC